MAFENLSERIQKALKNLTGKVKVSEEDINKAVDLLTKSANQNNLTSMIKLADLYGKGSEISQNYNKSFYWYNKALAFKSTAATFHVGLYYYHGYGVPKDEEKGIELIRQAKEKGYQRAANFFILNNIK